MEIVEHKACIPSCTMPPPTKEEMEDWVRIDKVYLQYVMNFIHGNCQIELMHNIFFVLFFFKSACISNQLSNQNSIVSQKMQVNVQTPSEYKTAK